MKNYLAIITLSCVLFLSIAINAQEKNYVLEKKDGVSYINNLHPLWENEPEIKLELEGYLGEFDSENEDYLLFKPVDIDADSDGNLYVLVQGDKCIQKYGPDKKFVKTIGQEGQGPGEFSMPDEIDIGKDNTIYVVDFGNARVDQLSLEGDYLRSIKFKRSYVNMFRTLNTGEIAMQNLATESIYRFRPEKGRESRLPQINIYSGEGKLDRKIGAGIVYKPDKDWRSGLNRIFFTVDKEDNIIVASIWRNRLEKYRPDGTMIFRTNRPIDPDNGIEELSKKSDKMLVDVDVDDKGRIWLLSKKYRIARNKEDYEKLKILDPYEAKTDAFILYLYDKNGVLLHIYQLDHFVNGIRAIGDKIYIVDTNYTMRFFIYNILEE